MQKYSIFIDEVIKIKCNDWDAIQESEVNVNMHVFKAG